LTGGSFAEPGSTRKRFVDPFAQQRRRDLLLARADTLRHECTHIMQNERMHATHKECFLVAAPALPSSF